MALVLGYALVVVGAIVAVVLWKWRDPPEFVPGKDFSAFAPLYVFAQSIERVLEPLSQFVSAPAPAEAAGNTDMKTAVSKVTKALADGNATDAATWQGAVDTVRKNGTVIMWGAASFAGMALCGAFGIYLLGAIGFVGVPKWADVIVSGLAIGSGTKPLHDLISNLQKSSAGKSDPTDKQSD